MYEKAIQEILQSLKWKDWIKILLTILTFVITNRLITNWLLKEEETRMNKLSGAHLTSPNQEQQKLIHPSESRKKRLEELSNKQKANSKLARQQRKEVSEIKLRLKEVEHKVHEKRIRERTKDLLRIKNPVEE